MGHGITAHLVGRRDAIDGPLLPVALIYRREQPWEVAARFGPHATWVFARDLLALGLHAPAGNGDVRLRPAARGGVVIELDNGQDTPVRVHLGRDALDSFVEATARLVPFGTEATHVDLDALADALTRGAA